MTVEEFDIRFDILYNNLASNAAVPLNAYEKSVFLSQAQRDIIIEIYNGRNTSGLSFESTEEARAYLRTLIVKANVLKEGEIAIEKANGEIAITNNKKYYKYIIDYKTLTKENDLWFITYEEVIHNYEANRSIPVIPVKQDDLHELLKNPFKCPSKNRILRIDVDGTLVLYTEGSEGFKTIKDYVVLYIPKPTPIILEGIDDDTLNIEGVKCIKDNISTGSAPEILHQAILESQSGNHGDHQHKEGGHQVGAAAVIITFSTFMQHSFAPSKYLEILLCPYIILQANFFSREREENSQKVFWKQKSSKSIRI